MRNLLGIRQAGFLRCKNIITKFVINVGSPFRMRNGMTKQEIVMSKPEMIMPKHMS